jgi:hypothetical protein
MHIHLFERMILELALELSSKLRGQNQKPAHQWKKSFAAPATALLGKDQSWSHGKFIHQCHPHGLVIKKKWIQTPFFFWPQKMMLGFLYADSQLNSWEKWVKTLDVEILHHVQIINSEPENHRSFPQKKGINYPHLGYMKTSTTGM